MVVESSRTIGAAYGSGGAVTIMRFQSKRQMEMSQRTYIAKPEGIVGRRKSRDLPCFLFGINATECDGAEEIIRGGSQPQRDPRGRQGTTRPLAAAAVREKHDSHLALPATGDNHHVSRMITGRVDARGWSAIRLKLIFMGKVRSNRLLGYIILSWKICSRMLLYRWYMAYWRQSSCNRRQDPFRQKTASHML